MAGKGQTQAQTGQTKRDALADEEWVTRIGYSLRNLADRSALNRRPLARLTCVEKAAEDAQGQIPAKDIGAYKWTGWQQS